MFLKSNLLIYLFSQTCVCFSLILDFVVLLLFGGGDGGWRGPNVIYLNRYKKTDANEKNKQTKKIIHEAELHVYLFSEYNTGGTEYFKVQHQMLTVSQRTLVVKVKGKKIKTEFSFLLENES